MKVLHEMHSSPNIFAHASRSALLKKWRSYWEAQPLDTWVVLLTILAALTAGWVHLRNSSIWYDEAITLLTTSGHAQLDWGLGLAQFKPSANLGKIFTELYQQDVHPPLYFWTLALWRVVFGPSLEVARALSTVFTAATLLVIYRLARDLGMKWPSIPVVVYALSAVGMRYAYNARPYAMASFLVALTLLLAHRRSYWTGITAAACVATHYFGALCVVPLLFFQCIKILRACRPWVATTAVSFALGCAPLLPLLHVHLTARPHQYPGFGPWPQEVWALLKGSAEGIMPSTWLPHWGFALWVAAVFIALGCRCVAKAKQRAVLAFVYLAFLSGFLALVLATNKSIAKMPTDYYLGLAGPYAALLIGFGVDAWPRTSPILGCLLLAGTITPVPMTKSMDYRAMAKDIRAHCSDCRILVGVGYAGAIPACMLYEAPRMQVMLLNPDDSVENVVERLGQSQTIILVPSNEPPTARIEHELVQAYPSSWKAGYYQIALAGRNRNAPVLSAARQQ